MIKVCSGSVAYPGHLYALRHGPRRTRALICCSICSGSGALSLFLRTRVRVCIISFFKSTLHPLHLALGPVGSWLWCSGSMRYSTLHSATGGFS